MNADTQIRLAILKELNDCSPLLQPEDTLLDGVRLRLAESPVRAEFEAALKHLELIGLVIASRDRVLGLKKWRLTEQGKSQLAELS